jgi:hypothetical protein
MSCWNWRTNSSAAPIGMRASSRDELLRSGVTVAVNGLGNPVADTAAGLRPLIRRRGPLAVE